MKINFVIPHSQTFTSGGNIYNAELITALKHKGLDVEEMDITNFKDGLSLATDNLCFIDSLYLDEFFLSKKDIKNSFLITHHLRSLDEEWKKAREGGKEEREYIDLKEMEQTVLKQFDGFLTTSKFTRAYLQGIGLSMKKYIVVPPALSFEPVPVKAPSDKIKGLMVANLIERKGILPFLRSLKNSTILPGNCEIRIAGSVELEPRYAQKCLAFISQDERLKKLIKFEGSCDQKQVQDLYRSSNLFISTAFMETFGMALQEAVAHRLPILAFDGGNTGHHIRAGENGYVFGSIEGLVGKLEHLGKTNGEFKTLADRAWNFQACENYTWDDAAEKLIHELSFRF